MLKGKRGWLFLAPFLIVFLVFQLYPFLLTFFMSMTNYRAGGNFSFIGFANYIRAFKDIIFLRSFFNTLRMWGVNIFFQILFALMLTMIFSSPRLKLKGLGTFRAIFYLPNLMAAVIVTVLFSALLDWKYGPINQILLYLKIIKAPINFLNISQWTTISVSGILTWMWFGHTFIVLMAGASGISKEYFEAAYVDGANDLQMFFKITLPFLRPVLLYTSITSLIGGLQLFDIPYLLTDGIGSPEGKLNTITMYIYNSAFRFYNQSYAAALSFVLLATIIVFSLIVLRIFHQNEVSK